MKKCGIYRIGCLIDGKIYVGQSLDIIRRICKHFNDLRKGIHHNPYLQRAFSKHGENNFEFKILREAPAHLLNLLERHWIKFYGCTDPDFGYNIWSGGNGAFLYDEVTRDKMSKARLGRVFGPRPALVCQKISAAKKASGWSPSLEHRQKISQALTGRTQSPEISLKISIANRGKKRSPEVCRAMSERMRGSHPSEEARRKMSESAQRRCLRLGAPMEGHRHSAATKAKISAMKLGVQMPPRSAEHRTHLSESQKRRFLSIT